METVRIELDKAEEKFWSNQIMAKLDELGYEALGPANINESINGSVCAYVKCVKRPVRIAVIRISGVSPVNVYCDKVNLEEKTLFFRGVITGVYNDNSVVIFRDSESEKEEFKECGI